MTKIKSMRRYVAFLVVVLAPALAYANTGVFEGAGHTIKLVRSEDVQLRSEAVTITPCRGPFLFDGTAPGMDRVEYRCKFVLHNRSRKPVTVQVGFPLTSDSCAMQDSNLKADDETALVLWYKFIARDNEKTYHVRFAPHDQDKKLGSIFLWDMAFQGDEVRELNVAYEIPAAMALNTTEKDWEIKYAKRWYSRLTTAIFEGFDYVTVTGQSWAGPIEHAKFELRVAGFDRYLANRFIIERPGRTAEERIAIEKKNQEHAARIEWAIKNGKIKGDPSELRDSVSNGAWQSLLDLHIKDRLIHRKITPMVGKRRMG